MKTTFPFSVLILFRASDLRLGTLPLAADRPINRNIPRDRALIHVYVFAALAEARRAEKRGESEL
jgi:hypothetical protein